MPLEQSGNQILPTATAARGGGHELETLSHTIHQTAMDKGFWDNGVTDDVVGTKLALIHSEVTEILEAIRKEQGAEALEYEFADVIIRLLDLWAALKKTGQVANVIDYVVQSKTAKNAERPHKHGNRF